MLRPNLTWLVPLVAAVGCGDALDERFPAPATTPLVGTLTRAVDCEDLVTRLRQDAAEKLRIDAYNYARIVVDDGYFYGPGLDAGLGSPAGAPPEADSASGGVRHSETNVQIQGVDEADFVETDGAHVYLLHDDQFMVFDTDPPGSVVQTASLALGGVPAAMFVDDGRAVVFSSFYTTISPVYGDAVPTCGWPYAVSNETKVTILDVTGDAPVIVSERFLNGSFQDARRHGDVVRVFLGATTRFTESETPPMPYDYVNGRAVDRAVYLARLEAWRDRESARIAGATLDAFVTPDARIVDGARVEEPVDCAGFYLGAPAETSHGLSRIVGFSITDPARTSTTAVSGWAGVEFASDDAVLLAEPDYRFDLLTGIATQKSALHAFTIDGIGLTFAGSGRIDGSILGSYSIDESEGVFRIVSTERSRGSATPDEPMVAPWNDTITYVSTFVARDGAMARVGRSEGLGAGETVQSVRFLGDTAYVVTFLQVDPLFVVDVADPAHPALQGELTIPGFSSYIHPLGDDHLLTVGTSQQWGLAIQVFDVADPTAPSQLHVHVLPNAYSTAQYDPHAFIFDAVSSLLAIPVTDYGANTFQSRLDLFRITVDGGIVPAGSIAHGSYFEDCRAGYDAFYGCAYVADVRRGLFIGDYVYAISTRAITAAATASVSVTTGAATLPAPTFWYPRFDTF